MPATVSLLEEVSAEEAAERSRLESVPSGVDPWPTRADAIRSAGIAGRLLGAVYGPALESVWLYGSRARGDHHKESDLDVLLVGDFTRDQDEFDREWAALCSFFDISIACIIAIWRAGPEQFRTWDTMFYRNVRKDAIPVFESKYYREERS